MKKILCFAIALLSYSLTSYSQTSLSLSWMKGIGSTNQDQLNASVTDASGNIYVTGYIYGTVAFDPSQPTNTVTSSNTAGYVAKYSSTGALLWVKVFSGTAISVGTAIDIDIANNKVLLAGTLNTGIADFDPSNPNTYTLSASGSGNNLFMATFNANTGACNFVQGLGNAVSNFEVNAIRAASGGDFIIAGAAYTDTNTPINYNPQGPGFSPVPSSSAFEGFIIKYNSSGQLSWGMILGKFDADYVYDLQLDAAGNIYACGSFQGFNVDFNPNGSPTLAASNGGEDMFLAKYNGANGQLIWLNTMGNTDEEALYRLKLDNTGNVVVTGVLKSASMDADPSPTTTVTLTKQGTGSFDMVLAKYAASNGSIVWAKNAGGAGSALITGLRIDSQNNILVCGNFNWTLNFDFLSAAPTVSTISTAPYNDFFVAKYKPNAALDVAKNFGGGLPPGCKVTGILLNASNEIILSGNYAGNVNVDPVATNTLPAYGGADMFLVKYTQCVMPDTPTLTVNSTSVCANKSVTLSISSGNLNSATNWSWANFTCGASSIGSGTSIVVSPAASSTYFVRGEGGCVSSANCASVSVTVIPSKNITGQATSTTVAVDAGKVILYRHEANLSKWDSVTYQNISSTGHYTFTGVNSGNYILLAMPTNTTLMNTYAPSGKGWKNAQMISHSCLTPTNVNINVIPLTNLGNGPGMLIGKIIEGPGYGQKPAGTMAPGNPIGGLTVKGGRNPGGDISAQTRTNPAGEFTLTGFPADVAGETYFVFVDVPGLDTTSTHHRAIVTGSLVHTHLNFVIDSMYIKPYTDVSVKEISINEQIFKVYPNPAQKTVYIEQLVKSKNYNGTEIILLDLYGKKLLDVYRNNMEEENRMELDISKLASGVYFLQFNASGFKQQVKIIKID